MVFHDPTGRRKRWLLYVEVLLLGCALLLAAAVVFSLTDVTLPGAAARIDRQSGRRLRERSSQRELDSMRLELLHGLEKPDGPPEGALQAQNSSPIVAAFFSPGPEAALDALRLNADKLTHLFPSRFHLSPDGSGLAYSNLDPFETADDREALDIARAHHVKIMPVLDNDGGNGFDAASVHQLLADPAERTAFIAKVVQQLAWVRFDGLNVDFENLTDEDQALMGPFLAEFASALHAAGMRLSADVTADAPDAALASWSSACDFVVLMAYDEHSGAGPAGPIASFGWFRRQLDHAAAFIPRDKLVIGVANYAYDWAAGAAEGKSLTYRQAVFALQDHRPGDAPNAAVDFDPSSLNSTGDYQDEKGIRHEVWLLDAVSAGDQWSAARRAGVRGAALWALGSEDPGVWSFLDRRSLGRPVDFAAMSEIKFPVDAEAGGEGEIYKIAATPTKGMRHLQIDPRTGICLDESYNRLPTVYQVRRAGKADKTLALTFDDGPSAEYTAAILDKLRDLHVPAAFFVVGDNALAHPELVRRIWAEGHEIGNHSFTHPDPARISENNFRLEINATQRVVQSLTGRSTLLLRPPYNGGPTLLDEVKPMTIASQLGYWTIDDGIDPKDWSLSETNGKTPVLRSAEDIAGEVIAQAHAGAGNVILLHDAGGDRSRTIKALGLFVPVLLAEGYRFESVSSLLGKSREETMPAFRPEDAVAVSAASAIFMVQRWWSVGLNGCVMLAIGLVTLRWIGLTALAGLHRRRDRRARPGAAGRRPTVSVIISAYNEEKVIARTVDTVLASAYEGLEVVVIDDGSSDGTSAEVRRRFGAHPKVKLIRQENAGKSAALNNGIKNCAGEILICLDADTLLAPDAIALMAACFADPTVGAAAGNVKICNAQNTLTRCQLIEYITNQNLERRAYEMLNAVTVVPGAVGAWRRSVVAAAGGYGDDTLAEDMDLTWRIRRAGWKIVTESRAKGYTEAPETLKALYTQRSRWTYGTLQCLWKHQDAFGRYGWFGALVLPSILVFQFLFQLVAPFIDVQLLVAAWAVVHARMSSGALPPDFERIAMTTKSLKSIGLVYSYFMLLELSGSLFAFALDGTPIGSLVLVLWQRLLYRYVMWIIVMKSLRGALAGLRSRWNKLARTGAGAMGAPPPAMPAFQPALSLGAAAAAAVLVLFLLAPSAAAEEGDLSAKSIFGPNAYVSNTVAVSAAVPIAKMSLGATYENVKSKISDGTYQTYTLVAGVWRPYAELYVFGALTPRVNTYQSKGYGASSAFRLFNTGSHHRREALYVQGQRWEDSDRTLRGYGILEYGRTFDANYVSPNKLDVDFHSVTEGLRLVYRQTCLSAIATQMLYDEYLGSPAFRRLESSLGRIISSFPQGYPNTTETARLTQDFEHGLWLIGEFSHAEYALAPSSSSNIYTAGGGWAWKRITATVEYHDYRPVHLTAMNYMTVTAAYHFGGELD